MGRGSWSLEEEEVKAEILVEETNFVNTVDHLEVDFDSKEDKSSDENVKRGRGRPRKNYAEEVETSLKRGRGRPKKTNLLDKLPLGEASNGRDDFEETLGSTAVAGIDEDFHFFSNDDSDSDFELSGDQRKKRSKQDRLNSEEQNSLKQKKKRKPNMNVKWPKDLLCPDCGENIGMGRSKDGGKYILRHQHQVENFVCECPDVPKLIVRPDQERVGKDFILKERHMKTVLVRLYSVYSEL